MTGAHRCGRRVSAAALLVVLAACASSPSGEGTEPLASEAAPSTAEGPDGGIGAGEAKERGVFVNAYDARLELVERSTSTAVLAVTNVGKKPDRYVLSVEPATGGVVTPAEIELQPGEDATVAVEFTGPATVRMVSAGRGDEVAALDVS